MAGSDIHGGPLFTMTEAPADLVRVEATPRYLALVGAAGGRPVGCLMDCQPHAWVQRLYQRWLSCILQLIFSVDVPSDHVIRAVMDVIVWFLGYNRPREISAKDGGGEGWQWRRKTPKALKMAEKP